jgi:aryl-alcohol dehydrogenase-like predicted oxidoreductase
MNRRKMIGGVVGAAVVAGAGSWIARARARDAVQWMPPGTPGAMRLRDFGKTGLKVSEVGFGSWGIGGSYGATEKAQSLSALARAEELGCNFVDSAQVYGDAEVTLGEFLQGRRSKWVVATKYSGQKAGLTATLESQLRRLQTDTIDLYQLHWVPRGADAVLFDELAKIRQAGKARFIGVSLYSAEDIDDVLDMPHVDAFQVAMSLLDPDPFMERLRAIHTGGKAVIVRSALREGFLTGKFKRDAKFPDSADQRHLLTPAQIARLVDEVERFRFLEQEAGSMVNAAARYPLSFADVSTVILGTKTQKQADSNFGQVPGGTLSRAMLDAIRDVQVDLELGSRAHRWLRRIGFAP